MTIAISVKVNDGVVIASDSASSLMGRNQAGVTSVINIYENANKIFNLIKTKPIGAITWGSGSIGQESISFLAKEFRDKITTGEGKYQIKKNDYTVEEIAKKFKKFIYDDKYSTAFKEWKEKPKMGFMIVGYSSNQPLAEEWKIDIENNNCNGPYIIRGQNQIGVTWNGEPEAISRLFLGVGTQLPNVLKKVKLDDSKIREIMELCTEKLGSQMVMAPMPIQDAIDLAIFLVETTIGYSKFKPGPPTVGGPIEVAAITKHESFRWIKRKHYWDKSLNQNEMDIP